MEAVLGGTLQDKMFPGKPLSTREACFVGLNICDALLVAHQRGMIHQDIKPSNIFYDEPLRWKLGDFGLARITKGSEIVSDDGTISYMAPEPNKSYKSDIYSLGLVLRQMLTGTRMGSIQEIRDKSELSGDRTEKLIDLIERMTHTNPNSRPNLNEVIQVLEVSTIQRPN